MRIESGQEFLVDKDLPLNEELLILGILKFDPGKSAKITTTKNIINKGKIVAQPSGHNIKHEIQFIGVNENNFVGGGMVPVPTDVGLWNMGPGVMDIVGTYKKPFTQCSSVNKGATSINCIDVTGWQIGDEIVVCPTEEPQPNVEGQFSIVDWDDRTNTVIDKYFHKFERRIIKSISGNTVNFDKPLESDHLQVKDQPPYVGNNTRNVKIYGTANGRSHIFACSHGDTPGSHHTQKHRIENLEMFYLGPRKGAGRPSKVLGRYALHFHHGGLGTEGSIIKGCAIHDIGNNGYVPHESHGLTFDNNICFNSLEAQFFWDWQTISHRIKWNNNLMMASRQNGIGSNSNGMIFNQGDDCEAKNNIAIYCHTGDPGSGAAYWWDADAEAVWIFENNISIACHSGLGTWQNSVFVHIIKNHRAYNCGDATLHGAYANMYLYNKSFYFKAKIIAKATATANNTGWENSVFDGDNRLNELVEVRPSPVPTSSTGNPNVFRNCVFKNAKVGIILQCDTANPDNTMKGVDVIGCTFENVQTQFIFGPGSLPNYFRVQDKAGNATKITKTGTTSIPRFAPMNYGTGEGLKGDYYNGANFESLALSRVDPMIYYQQWRKDKPIYPLGVNAKIKGTATTTEPFSIRWTGKIEAQWSEPHVFRFMGGSAYRLWIDNKIVIDSWVKKGGNIATDSAPIALVAGRQYDIRIDLSDTGVAPLGIVFYWKSPSMSRFNEVPYSQLYSGNIITPPPIPPIMTPCEEFKWEDYLELQKDLRPAGVDTEAKALRHYQVYGIKEKRRANKLCLDPTLVPAIGTVPPPVEREFSLTDKSGVESTFKLVGKTLEIK